MWDHLRSSLLLGPQWISDFTPFGNVIFFCKHLLGIRLCSQHFRNPSLFNLSTPTVPPSAINPGATYSKVNIGWGGSDAITTAGVLQGLGSSGSDIFLPLTTGTLYQDVNAEGIDTTCALARAGQLQCWGRRNELGMGVNWASPQTIW